MSSTPTQIVASSPAGSPGTVDVTVATPDGTSGVSPADQFTYTAAPEVTGLSPALGPPAGGTTIVITGADFTGATAVDFGTTAASSFVVNSGTQITVTSPVGTAGGVDVTVVTPNGTSSVSAADQFTYLAIPTVAGVSTGSGPAAGGTTVTITGSDFTAQPRSTSARSPQTTS